MDWREASDDDLKLVVLSNRIIYGIACCITSAILIKEIQQRIKMRQRITDQQTKTTTSHYEGLLKFWGLMALITYPLAAIFAILNKTNIICDCVMNVTMSLFSLLLMPIQFYQVTRLQYTFSVQQIHSNWGYSKSTFIYLYLWGIFIIIYVIIFQIMFYKTVEIEMNGNLYGCDRDKAFESSIRTPVFFVVYIVYWAWDLLVLFLYIRKIRQFAKASSKIDQNVYSRVSYVLNKILFLKGTLIMHI